MSTKAKESRATTETPESKDVKAADKAAVKIVKIQDLPPVKTQDYGSWLQKPVDRWKAVGCEHGSRWGAKDATCQCNILAYYGNGEVTSSSHNAFFDAFLKAYNTHGDVVLSPDDVWMCVCLQFSKYINNNAEKMRPMFVAHEGKKKLTVTTHKQLSESEWDEFFALMIEAIRENTKGGIVDTLESKFTTTGTVERLLSIATVMDSFKAFFEYGRCIPCCGIQNVHFMGTLGDWQSVFDKTKALGKHDVDGTWTTYIKELLPVLTKFIETYEGRVDKDWWNKVMNITSGRLGSGSTSYVSGWILKFFNVHSKIEMSDVPEYKISVPVVIDNKLTGTKKTVKLIGGFGGVVKSGESYRPQLSMVVFHDGNTEG